MANSKIQMGPLKFETGDKFRGKLRGLAPGQGKELARDGEVAVLIQVRESEYVPCGVTLVSRITPFMFTARLVGEADLERIAEDDQVIRIEFSQSVTSRPRGNE